MAARLRHRGTSGTGSFIEGPVALAKTARRILGSEPDLPLVADDLVVMVDGRIYDHELLTRAVGHDKPVESATEAVLVCWRKWGVGLAQRLDGAFSIVVWDRRKQVVHLVRDRLGVRPLFWARKGDKLAFASELPALLEVPWVSRDLARENVSEYLSFRVVHAPRTLLRDVHQVEPGHWFRAKSDDQQTRRYWSPLYAPRNTPRPSQRDVIPALQDAVQHAVKRRLIGANPTGLYLSGGLGSTAIAAACKRLTRPLPTFTMSFDDDPFPEAPFAGRVARLLGLDHHDVLIGTPDLAGSFEDGIRALGHPIGNPAVFLQLMLARVASEHVQVVLSGDGGEELFGGRMMNRFARYLTLAKQFQKLPGPARAMLAVPLRQFERGHRVVIDPANFGLELEVGGSRLFDANGRMELFREPVLARPMVRHDVLQPFYQRLETDPVNAALHAFLRSWLGDDSLVRFDRTANAAGIDIRFPLLDQEVVKMAAALPGAFKLRRPGGSVHSRWPLMAMLDGVLPPTLINRPKRGMPTPLDPWLNGPGRLFLEERFRALKADRSGLYKPESLDQLRRDVGRKPGAGAKLWALIILDSWLELVVN